MDSFFSFFRGLSLASYAFIALGSLLAISWTTIYFMGRNIGNLHEDIAVANVKVQILVDLNAYNLIATRDLERELQRCVFMRSQVEVNALKATEKFSKASRASYKESDKRRDGIDAAIKASDDTEFLPPRATELLIEAARSANRDGNDS